jgi:hypothetical protein
VRRAIAPVFLPSAAKSTMPDDPIRLPPRRSRLPETALIASWSQKHSTPLRPWFTPVER